MISNLEKNGFIASGNYGGNDRTKWFRPLAQTVVSISPNGPMHSPKRSDVYKEQIKTTDNKPQIEIEKEKKETLEIVESSPIEIALSVFEKENPKLAEAIRNFLLFRKEIKKPLKDASFPTWCKKLEEYSAGDPAVAVQIIENSIANGWQGIFPMKSTHREEKDARQNAMAAYNFT